nr:MAG TPA: major capsid protein [Caudoviricetes sp.]
MNELMNLRDKRVQTWNAAKAFLESHRGTDGTLSAEDDAIFNKMMDEVDKLGKEVVRLEKLEALDVEMSKATSKPLSSAPVTRLDEEPVSKTGRGTKGYNTSFWKVMRNKFVPHEVLNALHVGTDTEGGYLVPDEYERTLIEALEEQNIFRQLAHVIHTSSGERKIPVVASKGTASWIDEEAAYDKEYALIQLIENSAERQQALDALNARYNSDRRAAAMEYAQLMADVVMPVWQQSDIQEAKTQVGDLMQLLRQYSAASTDAEKKSFLPQPNQLTASMDEGALTEYVALLTQIQSLLDSGMSESEVQAMFPDIDFSSALEQLAAIQTYLNQNKWDTNLTSLNEMFGEAVGEEVLKITTDLDMTGAQARWDEWASNPGAITTDAVIQGYTEAENATKQQPLVDAFVAKYTEQPEGADKSSLTPAGLVAYVQTYAEATTGTDVSGLNPTNVTAMVSAYKELASGTDVTQLKPSEITAYVFKYLEDNKVDTTGLTPEAVTAFVMAYEEVTGGASTAALKPSDVVGLITKYAEAENVDVSALTSAQVEGIVTKFAEATGCDKSELMREFTAYITEYKEAAGVKKPTLNMQVGLSGYDLLAYRRWLKNNKVEVEGVVRLSEVYEDPSGVLGESGVKYWKDGQEIPVTAVTSDMLRPDDVAILDKDGTMHILLTTEITRPPAGTGLAITEL